MVHFRFIVHFFFVSDTLLVFVPVVLLAHHGAGVCVGSGWTRDSVSSIKRVCESCAICARWDGLRERSAKTKRAEEQ